MNKRTSGRAWAPWGRGTKQQDTKGAQRVPTRRVVPGQTTNHLLYTTDCVNASAVTSRMHVNTVLEWASDFHSW